MPDSQETQGEITQEVIPLKVGQLSLTSRVRARGRPAIEIHADAAKKPFLGEVKPLGVTANDKWKPTTRATFIPTPIKELPEQLPRKRMTAKQKFFDQHVELDQNTPEGKKVWREEIVRKDNEARSAWAKGQGAVGEDQNEEEAWAEHKAEQKEKRSKARRKNSAIRAAILGDVLDKKKKISPAPESGKVLIALDKVAGVDVPRVLSAEKRVPVSVQLKQTDDGTNVNVLVGYARDDKGRKGKVSVGFKLPAVILPVLIEEGERVLAKKEKKGRPFVLPVIGLPDLSKINFDKRLLIPATLIPLICLAGLLASSGRSGDVPTFPTLTVSPTPIEAFMTSPVVALPIPALPGETNDTPVIISTTPPTVTVPLVDVPKDKQPLPAGLACGPGTAPSAGPETFAFPKGSQPNLEALESSYQQKADFQNAEFDRLCVAGLATAIKPDGTLDPELAAQVMSPEEIRTWNSNAPDLDRYEYVDDETGQRDERGDSFGPKS